MIMKVSQNRHARLLMKALRVRNDEVISKFQGNLTHRMILTISLEAHQFRSVKIHPGKVEILQSHVSRELTRMKWMEMILEVSQNLVAEVETNELLVRKDEVKPTLERRFNRLMILGMGLPPNPFRGVKIRPGRVKILRKLVPRKLTRMQSKEVILKGNRNHHAQPAVKESKVRNDKMMLTFQSTLARLLILLIRLKANRFQSVEIHPGRVDILRNLLPLKSTRTISKEMVLEGNESRLARAEVEEWIVRNDEMLLTV
jgi:hypothetical protein